GRSRRQRDEVDREDSEKRGRNQPAEQPEAGDENCTQAQVPPKRVWACTLRLQIEKLAALVASVSGEEHGEPAEREQEGDARCPRQRGQRAAGERVGAEAILDLGTGRDRERRERRPLELGAEVLGPGEPELRLDRQCRTRVARRER